MFGEARYYAVGSSPIGLAAGEFSGTAGLDLAAANEGNTITLLQNEGDGVFNRGGAIQIDQRYTATSVTVGTFNVDGIDDIAISADDLDSFPSFNGSIVVYRSTQPFRYNATAIPVGVLPGCIAYDDLTGEGLFDLAACDSSEDGGGQISLVRGTSNGGFSVPQGIGTDEVAPTSLIPADIDQDSRPDLLVLDRDDNNAYLMYGAGSNPVFANPVLLETVDSPVAAVVDFLDGDDLLDIAIASRNTGQVYVFLQTAARTFASAGTFGLGFFPSALATADFNGDDKLDLLSANSGSSDVTLLYGNGDGTFRPGETVPVGLGPVALVVEDFNRDGKPDFATVNQDDVRFGANSQSVSVVLNGVTPPLTPTPTASFTRTPTITRTSKGTPTATRTPRRSLTPTRTGSPAPTTTPAGPADRNCDGRVDDLDVRTVIVGIFQPGAGCLAGAVNAASILDQLRLIAIP